MALKTAGTATTTSLKAIQWNPGAMSVADFATFVQDILDPTLNVSPTTTGWVENGTLFLPGRPPSMIILTSLDWLLVDGAGWPIVVPNSIFATSWVHS